MPPVLSAAHFKEDYTGTASDKRFRQQRGGCLSRASVFAALEFIFDGSSVGEINA